MKSTVLFLLAHIIGVKSLVLKELEVPSHVGLGSSVRLVCQVEVSESKLYSINWYKDELEFCRFMPSTSPQLLTFSVPGIRSEDVKCGNTTVVLDKVSMGASGTYKCEASTEAPTFQTVMNTRKMSVMVYPTNDPVITGVLPYYLDGQYIDANCTAPPSNPAPDVTWSINGVPADTFLTHEYTEIVGHLKLFKRTVCLRLMVQESLFGAADGRLVLFCTSTLPGLPPWQAMARTRIKVPFQLSRVKSNITDGIFKDSPNSCSRKAVLWAPSLLLLYIHWYI